jgi:hypothetical protein
MAAWCAADNRVWGGTAPFPVPFGRQEEPMIKALLTPVILGLAVAMVIRMSTARRA